MEVVSMLNAMYTKFDQLSEEHKVYKVNTPELSPRGHLSKMVRDLKEPNLVVTVIEGYNESDMTSCQRFSP